MSQTRQNQKNETRLHRDDHKFHLNVIAKSISQMVDQTVNEAFKNDVKKVLNMKCDKQKTIQTKLVKLMNTNYEFKAKK